MFLQAQSRYLAQFPIVSSLTPRQLIVVSPTETATIWDMHRLGVALAEATPLRPRDLLPYDWDYMSDDQRAMAIADAASRSVDLRHDISLLASEESSLLFSETFKSSGSGPVYVLRASSAYEIGPSELSQILKIHDVDTSDNICLKRTANNFKHIHRSNPTQGWSAELVASDALQLYEPGCTGDAAITSSDEVNNAGIHTAP